MIYNKDDIIHCKVWETLSDYVFNSESPGDLPSGIVHCELGAIPYFFEKIKGNGKSYIVISSCADWTLCLQKEYPPHKDIGKTLSMWAEEKHGYSAIQMPPRLKPERCRQDDKYSIKCYIFTEATFNEIPLNVKHWFCTNCLVDDPRITPIPFGINSTKFNFEPLNYILKQSPPDLNERKKILYVNFQTHTLERLEAYNYYKTNDLVTVKYQVPWEEYVCDIMEHKYNLCLSGNGIDCYRTMETIYLGGIPIVPNNLNFQRMAPYVSLRLSDLHLLSMRDILYLQYESWHGKFLGNSLKFWENLLTNARKKL